jgi:hypothetical protein
METRATAAAIIKRPDARQRLWNHLRNATLYGHRRGNDRTVGPRRLVGLQRGTALPAMTAGMIDVSSPGAPGAVTPLLYTIVGPQVREALGSPIHGEDNFPDF